MWLTGRLAPDHKTIADFRKDNGRAIRQVCARFVALCRAMACGKKMTNEQMALEFEDKLYASAMNVVGAATGQIDNKWNRDPKIIGLTILCRTLSTFKAALVLVRAGQVMEARMLARPLYENCLWIAALRERRTKFVEEMVEDDALNRRTLGQITMKLTAQHGGDVNNPGAMLLRQIIRELADTYKDPRKLYASDVAAMGVIGLYYVDYTRLSLDSLHCSFTALGRHIKSERVLENRTMVNISIEPQLHNDEIAKTVRHLCRAVMAVAITANELMGNTSTGGQLTTAVQEFDRMGWARIE
jgi:hypothetical protein